MEFGRGLGAVLTMGLLALAGFPVGFAVGFGAGYVVGLFITTVTDASVLHETTFYGATVGAGAGAIVFAVAFPAIWLVRRLRRGKNSSRPN